MVEITFSKFLEANHHSPNVQASSNAIEDLLARKISTALDIAVAASSMRFN